MVRAKNSPEVSGEPLSAGRQARPQKKFFSFRAKNGIRTRDLHLGKVALYQLSYFRILKNIKNRETWWRSTPEYSGSYFRDFKEHLRCEEYCGANLIHF